MLLNYIKIAVRLLLRNPFFGIINVAGLAVGFAVFFVLWPFAVSELQSDKFIKDHDRISRILFDWNWSEDGGKSWGHLIVGSQLSHISKELYDQRLIDDFTRYIPYEHFYAGGTEGFADNWVITAERRHGQYYSLKEEKAITADKNIFEFFDLEFISGDRASALDKTGSVAISESNALRIFGELPQIGHWIKVNGKDFTVMGIFRDLPLNSHLQFDMVFTNASVLQIWNQRHVDSPWTFHYCRLKNASDSLTNILEKNKNHLMGWYLNKNPHVRINLSSQPLTEIVFSENYNNDTFENKSRFSLKILAAVSLVVLIMAWMNYVNLTISQTKNRFKEIAARKVSGAVTRDLFLQFGAQAAVVNILAAALGITVIQLIRQPFYELFRISITPPNELDSTTAIFLSIVVISGIVITALYPALITHRLSARQLLGQKVTMQKQFLPSALTTIQYTIALVLIAIIFISSAQLHYILSSSHGINKENVVVIESPLVGLQENGQEKMSTFAKEIESHLQPVSVSLSGRVLGDIPFNGAIRRPGEEVFYAFDHYGGVDENFIALYDLKLIAGRNFSADEKTLCLLVSRLATQRLGFKSPEDAIGTFVVPATHPEPRSKIVGVFEDFRSMPLLTGEGSSEAATGRGQCMSNFAANAANEIPGRLSIKLKEGQLADFIRVTEKLYNDLFPGNVFSWYFIDKHINRHYQDQNIIRNQISFFTFLAVAVACLGLLGMISNKVADKIKEISIRRILGAHNLQIGAMLLDTTFKQILVAMVIGVPIAWMLANEYLRRYTERISLHWWHFIFPLIILLSIMFATIASVLWNATRTNPVEALKHD